MIRKHRLYLPVFLVLLAVAGWVYVEGVPELDFNFRAWANWGIGLLLGLLVLVWFVFLSCLPWRSRLLGLAGLILGLGALRASVRLDGSVSGTGLPKYRWFWKQPRDFEFVPKKAAEQTPVLVAKVAFPQFLGVERSGVVSVAGDWSLEGARELWRQPIGEGWGGYCVVDHRAVTLEQRGEEEWVSCYDLGSGALLWHHAEKTRFVEWQGGDGPRATPAHHAGAVYAIGATGRLLCLDLVTGVCRWSRDVLTEHKGSNLKWGISGSPLLHEGLVIVTGGDVPGPTLLAYDMEKGELKWKSGEVAATYASPALTSLCGRSVLLYNAAPGLLLANPASGELLHLEKWGSPNFPKASQPLVLPGDRVFLSAGYSMGCVMFQFKLEAGGKFTAEELWAHNKMKTQFASVTAWEGHLYGLDDGKLACLDMATGERLWKTGSYGAGVHLLLSPKSQVPLALVQSEEGPVHLVRVTTQASQEVAQLPVLSSKTWNYPTVADNFLLCRNDREAVCYQLATKGE